MTQTLTANENNDVFIGADGKLAFSSGLDAVKYACSSAAKSQLGEMIYAIDRGIPNFQVVWVGAPNLAVFENYLRETLESVYGVNQVIDLETKSQNNVLSYSASIETRYGGISLNV